MTPKLIIQEKPIEINMTYNISIKMVMDQPNTVTPCWRCHKQPTTQSKEQHKGHRSAQYSHSLPKGHQKQSQPSPQEDRSSKNRKCPLKAAVTLGIKHRKTRNRSILLSCQDAQPSNGEVNLIYNLDKPSRRVT